MPDPSFPCCIFVHIMLVGQMLFRLLERFSLVVHCHFCLILLYESRYVHNNIFFSFAVDADLEQLSRKQGADSKVEGTGLLRSLSEKTSNNLSQGASEVSNGDEHGGPVVEAVNINLDCPPGVPGETQLAESEQATYASANNDLKGTKSYQEADVPGLYNLAMAIIDYRGHRVVAQVFIELVLPI